ncbi:MAG: PmoA family protein [Pirellulaceae bacterium]|nr:PmoA family protein [Pirellulaceae bacterium]
MSSKFLGWRVACRRLVVGLFVVGLLVGATWFDASSACGKVAGDDAAGDNAADSEWVVMRLAAPPDVAAAGPLVVVKSSTGDEYVAQVGTPWLLDQSSADKAGTWLTWIAPRSAAGPWTYVPAAEAGAPAPTKLAWIEGQASAGQDLSGDVGGELRLGEQPVLRLMAKAFDGSSPDARDETYKIFHHLWMPGLAEPITKGAGGLFPHHRGLFVGWNRIAVTQNGIKSEVDTWHAKKAHQELARELIREAGPVYGRQVLVVDWINETVEPPQPFIRETRELIVFPIGNQRLVQFSTRLESLAGEITLAGDPQHAGFQFRASQHVADVSKDQTYYLRPDGIDRPGNFRNWPDQAAHVELPFHAMSFVINGQRMTCARLEHPSNPGEARFSERDYGRFGSYFEHRLTADQPLEIRYQLRTLPGETDPETLAAWQRDFAEPTPQQWSTGQEPEFPATLAEVLQQRRPLSEGPVFRGAPGCWDAAIRERGWVLFDQGQYKLWYTGYDGQRTSIKRLGLATSADGLLWERSSSEPLIGDQWIEDMTIVRHRGSYWMFAEGPNDIAQGYCSADGLRWQHLGALDIREMDGQPISSGPRGTPAVVIHNDDWYLFYERRDAAIWLAKARASKAQNDSPPTLPVWQNVQDEPVMGLSDREYDQTMIALNQVVPVSTGYLAMFHSSSDAEAPRRWVCSAAYSPDMRHWVKLDQPLTTLEQNQSSGLLVESPAGWRFYTTHGQVSVYELPKAIQ